jgi:hypothetical protein
LSDAHGNNGGSQGSDSKEELHTGITETCSIYGFEWVTDLMFGCDTESNVGLSVILKVKENSPLILLGAFTDVRFIS